MNREISVDTQPIPSDRSRISDAEKCMRLRYWRYEHEGIGVEQGGQWLDPLIGTAVHTGIEHSLKGFGVEDCVSQAREVVRLAQRSGPILIFRQGLDPARDIEEGLLLAEALVRGWASVRLPKIQAEFEVIAIEREMHKDFHGDGRTVRLLTRPDIVMRRRSDGRIFVRNLKTASRVDDKWRDKWRYDMSTFSEALAVEELLGEPVAGTIMEGIVKGSRKDYPMGSGDYHWDSPLLFAWKRDGEPPMTEDEWYGRYEWSCTAPHVMGNGRKCPGSKSHRLSGVHKYMVTTRLGGVSGWIDYLGANDRSLLEEQFVELTPILRSAYEIERWKRQKLPMEVEIREHRDHLRSMQAMPEPEFDEALLDRWFPMSTADGNCVWPSKCAYFEICHGTQGDDLAGNGFVPRNPNHPAEANNE